MMTDHWPPLIDANHVPWWARLRDVLMTLAAWLLLAYLMSPVLLPLWHDLLAVLGLRDVRKLPNLARAWSDLRPFLLAAAALMLWLTSFALVRRRLLLTIRRSPYQPAALDNVEQARTFGLGEEQRQALQQAQVATLRFDSRGRIDDVSMNS